MFLFACPDPNIDIQAAITIPLGKDFTNISNNIQQEKKSKYLNFLSAHSQVKSTSLHFNNMCFIAQCHLTFAKVWMIGTYADENARAWCLPQ